MNSLASYAVSGPSLRFKDVCIIYSPAELEVTSAAGDPLCGLPCTLDSR